MQPSDHVYVCGVVPGQQYSKKFSCRILRSVVGVSGLLRKPETDVCVCARSASSGLGEAVSMTTTMAPRWYSGNFLYSSRNSHPFMAGMLISRKIKSGDG